MENEKNKGGAPSIYTQELANKLCALIAEGKSLRTVCSQEGMPDKATVFNWLSRNKSFLDQYELAKQESARADDDELQFLGDEAIRESKEVGFQRATAVVSAYKLKADNLKWAMSKKQPKKYGDKVDMTTNGKDLPTPIVAITPDVLRNDSNEKG